MDEKQYYVYIITNYEESVLYTGKTNDLQRRIYEHKNKLLKSFSKQYNINKLVYYEIFGDIEQSILREKQIKGGSRQRKIKLINEFNPQWIDLADKDGQIASAVEAASQ